MAVIDAAPRFQTAVRGYDRAAVDALIRNETAHLDALNTRIAELEWRLAADRGAAFRVDDPQRKQQVRAAADMLADAWDHARAVVTREDATANVQREHAASIVAAHLAEVYAAAEAEERRVQAEADALVAAARQEAARILEQADEFVANAEPMAEQLLIEANEQSGRLALDAENAVHAVREAIEAELTLRQREADAELAEATLLAEEFSREALAVAEHATHVRESSLTTAHAFATDLMNEVADKIARLEAESDAAMAELAELMASLSTEVRSARKTLSARATRTAPAEPVAPEPRLAPGAPRTPAPVPVATTAPAAPPASAQATRPRTPRKVATTAAVRTTRKTTPAPAAGLLSASAAKAVEAPEKDQDPETSVVEAARVAAGVKSRDSVTIMAPKPSVIRL